MFFRNRSFNRLAERYLAKIEVACAFYRGKGWGEATVKNEVEEVLKLLGDQKPVTVLDIGANKGLYTQEIVDRVPDARVAAFEPAQANLDLLTERFHGANVKIEPFALASETGSGMLYFDKPGSGLASLTKRRLDHHSKEMGLKEEVKTIRFEDYWVNILEKRPIEICKIDVEGHELDVLRGFGEAIDHVRLIQFEFGGCNIDTRTYFQDFWYFFVERNFEIFRLTPFGSTKVKKYKEELECFQVTNFVARRIER